jgi:hypothetical protein
VSGITPSGQFHGQHHVFKGGQIAKQLKTLKHKTNLFGPQGSAGIFVNGKNILPRQPHGSATGRVKTRNDGQQCAFA